MDGEWNKFLGKLDYGFTCIFAIEVLLKVRSLESLCMSAKMYHDIFMKHIFMIHESRLLAQILDYGLILHPGSYMREMWNCMDLIVVSCALTSFIMDMT